MQRRYLIFVLGILLIVSYLGARNFFKREQRMSSTTSLIVSVTPKPVEIPTASGESPVVPAPNSTPITLTFVGDIMLDRDVWDRMRQSGADYPFRKIGDLFSGSDAVVANLEGPVTKLGTHSVVDGALIFSFDPSVVAPLRQAGITAVSLANNHTYNQGKIGLDDTRSGLDAAGIASFGDPRIVDATRVTHLTIHDRKIALVGWNTIGITNIHLADLLDLVRKEQVANDFVVVMPHWGVEYQQQTATQISEAHQIVDAGADLIIGAHPHVVQGYEKYHDRLIMYSMGNFIFDQYWSMPTQRAIAVRYVFDANKQTATVIPIRLEKAQPTKASGDIYDQILRQLDLRSDTITLP